jgi:hypothetical protein
MQGFGLFADCDFACEGVGRAQGLGYRLDVSCTGRIFRTRGAHWQFRLGNDELIANEKHESRISMEDYAIALVDELEKPAHRNQRFSVGY